MNEKKEYLSEKEYLEKSKKLKSIGKTLLIVGVTATVLSFIVIILGVFVFGNTGVTAITSDVVDNGKAATGVFGGFGIIALGGFLNTIGFPLMIAGAVTMFIAHRREIASFTTQQVMPVAQEGIEKMAPTVGGAAKEIAKGIKEGINEADNKNMEEETSDEEK